MKKGSLGPDNPLVKVAKQFYDFNLDMEYVDFETLPTFIGTDIIESTVKYDGEFRMAHWQRGDDDCSLVRGSGTVVSDIPPSQELATILSKSPYESVTFATELYAVNPDGSRMGYDEVTSYIRSPNLTPDQTLQIRLAIFDVLMLDGKPVTEKDYWKRIGLAHDLIRGAKYSHVAEAVRGDIKEIRKFWDEQVVKKGMEGIVLQRSGKFIKSKKIYDVDVVMVGLMQEGKEFAKGRAGSVLCATTAPDGTFVVCGRVTINNNALKAELFSWISENAVGSGVYDKKPVLFCKPQLVLRVEILGVYLYSDPELPAYTFDGSKYSSVGNYPGFKLREPRNASIRYDRVPGKGATETFQWRAFDQDAMTAHINRRKHPPTPDDTTKAKLAKLVSGMPKLDMDKVKKALEQNPSRTNPPHTKYEVTGSVVYELESYEYKARVTVWAEGYGPADVEITELDVDEDDAEYEAIIEKAVEDAEERVHRARKGGKRATDVERIENPHHPSDEGLDCPLCGFHHSPDDTISVKMLAESMGSAKVSDLPRISKHGRHYNEDTIEYGRMELSCLKCGEWFDWLG